MSLIERLGGYERAKAFLNAASYTMDELIMMQRSGLRTQHVEKALLEYRRQHNIFEVGDLVVLPYTNYRSDVFELTKLLKEIYDEKGVAYRHATDEEIKAGKRLEVK